MKKTLTLAALLLVISTGLFAAAPVKNISNNNDDNNAIVVQAMRTALGFGISIQHTTAAGYVVIIDNNHKVILNDKLAKGKAITKAYNLSELETGDYALTVNANNSTVNKKLHVYEEYGKKAYVFLQ